MEIKSLSHKMETMAFEFADMLKETLDKMSQRIEVLPVICQNPSDCICSQ